MTSPGQDNLEPAPAPADAPVADSRALDRAARWPVLALLLTGLFWLAPALVLQVLAAIKLHAPGMLAGCSWLTYGRVQPAAWNLFVFGFGIPTGMGVAAWLTSRLSRAPVAWGWLSIVGVKAWSVGVLFGVIGILAGGNTGLEGLEMPAAVTPVLFAGYLLMAAGVLRTFAARTTEEVYVSQWHVLAAVVSLPWFHVSAVLLAVVFPLRGVLPAVVAAWFVHGVFLLWFGGLALAVLFYFVPKFTGQPLPNRNLAIFGFWTLLLFGPLGGAGRQLDGPFPAWLSSLGMVSGVFLLMPACAWLINLRPLLRGQRPLIKASNTLGFVVFAGAALLLWTLLTALNGFQAMRFRTGYTLFGVALDWLLLWGGFGMAMLGAIYYCVPRLLGADWQRPAWGRWHLGLAAGGVVILVLSGLLGGWVHGGAINDPALPYVQVAKRYIPFAATGTLAFLILLVGALLLIGQVKWLLWRACGDCCLPRMRSWFRPAEAEVNS